MLWLCLRFPLLPLEVFTRTDEIHERAVAIVEKGRVLCLNPAAAQQGITASISAATAQAMCSGLHVRERAPALEAGALTELADWAWRFTPQLCPVPPARLLLEIGASLRLFGGIRALLGAVRDDLAARSWTADCGLAPTPIAAELFSRAQPCSADRLPCWYERDETAYRQALGALPLELLEAPEREQQTMQRMGFRRTGELFALSRTALGRRFGKEFLRYLMRLRGDLPDPRPAYRPREHFAAGLHFLDPVAETQRLLFPMRRLLGELGQFLVRRQCFCQRLEWQLQPAHGTLRRVPVACSLEHHREGVLLDLTRLALERLRLAEPVASLALHCRELAPLAGHNADLFDEHTHAGAESEHRLLDRLRLRLGRGELHGVLLADTHLPERAWCATPASGAGPCGTHRPCWLLREPAPVTHDRHGLDWNGPLELLGGPERIESEWWDSTQSRDYFVARSRAGALVWVYRDRERRRWFVQGVFG